MEEESINNIERFDIIEPSTSVNNEDKKENKKEEELNEKKSEEGKKKCCKFPTAYSVLLIIQVFVFFLTFIIPKGRYATIIYDDVKDVIVYSKPDPQEDPIELPATQETLVNIGVQINIENFKNGNIRKAVAVPGTYARVKGIPTKFFDLITNPISGMIESADISFFLMILGGNINVLIEMKALTNGLHSLAKILKGRGFILLCIIMILISIGGTTFGMAEETLAFYPILMPIFLKNGLDGMLSTMSLISGSSIGTMFSTVNAFAVVIASYSAGISFSDGLWFRLIALIFGDLLTCGFFYFYYRRIQIDEKRSVCYSIKEKLEEKFLEKKNEETAEKEGMNSEESSLKDEKIKKESEKEKEKEFTLIQKIAMIIFLCGFIVMIIGVVALQWWFDQMTSVFLVIGIILMILLREEESKAVNIFNKGVGDFASISLTIGLARGINITLEKGMISDTLLYALSNTIGNMNKVLFAILMVFIFMILGFFIQSSSGLAVLSMPIFAPLAENVGCSRTVIVNAYMFGQNFISFLAPTGLLLIILQLTGVSFNFWIKFIWPFLVILLIYILILIMINSAL